MDRKLAQYIIDMEVLRFGDFGKYNKKDSRSLMCDPRNLLSDPDVLKYIGKQMAKVIKTKCSGNFIVGLVTAGVGFGAVASIYADMPCGYLRSVPKGKLTNKWLEGLIPKKPTPKMIVVDELIFHGRNKKAAVSKLKELGYKVTDVVVAIDRQCQTNKLGPDLETYHNVKLHSLIDMDDIVEYLIEKNKITKKRLKRLILDYREHHRWFMPKFAQSENEEKLLKRLS